MRTEFDRMAALMALDDGLEVYQTKDESKSAQRTRRKAHIVAWVVAELAKGPCLRDVPGVTVRYRDEEWTEAVLSTVYDVELDIEEFLRAERRAIEAEAEP